MESLSTINQSIRIEAKQHAVPQLLDSRKDANRKHSARGKRELFQEGNEGEGDEEAEGDDAEDDGDAFHAVLEALGNLFVHLDVFDGILFPVDNQVGNQAENDGEIQDRGDPDDGFLQGDTLQEPVHPQRQEKDVGRHLHPELFLRQTFLFHSINNHPLPKYNK